MCAIAACAAAILTLSPVGAQSYQCTQAQMDRLEGLLKGDAAARAAFAPLEREATAALSAAPRPVAAIRSEGLLDADPLKIATEKALGDMGKVFALSLMWRLERKPETLGKASDYLLAWAGVNRGRGDPIDDTNLEPAFRAYDLLREALGPADRAKIEAWFSQVADAEIEAFAAHPDRTTSFNNWNSHRLKIVGLAAFATGDGKYLDFVLREFPRQLSRDFLPDGSSFDFHERDALHYHLYSVLPLLSLCEAAAQNGRPLYPTSVEGRSIAKAVGFAMPYIEGRERHAEFLGSKVEFDRKRAEAGQKAFAAGAAFDPKEALPMLEAFYYFDPEVLPLIQKLRGNESPYPSWAVLLESVERARP
jgi:hypothetical protein